MNKLGIYIHIPFCLRKCPYCDFYSVAINDNTANEYVEALCSHILSYKENRILVDTVYFGGGTPTSLPAGLIARILNTVREAFVISDDSEITIEANPCTVDEKYLRELYENGINRISFGVQSACDSELERLGRLHNFYRARSAVITAYDVGFRNISCDLMIGVLGQTPESLSFSIDEFSKLPINHISAYMLKVEAGTPYDCDCIRKELFDDDTQADMYLLAVKRLESNGFLQYEISNFCKDNMRSRHNTKYWQLNEYIGFGPSAHSYYDGKRFFYSRDIKEYINNPASTYEVEDASPDKLTEYTMLSLRLVDGLSLKTFAELGGNIEVLERLSSQLCKSKLAVLNDDILKLTPNGFLVSNSIIASLLDE